MFSSMEDVKVVMEQGDLLSSMEKIRKSSELESTLGRLQPTMKQRVRRLEKP